MKKTVCKILVTALAIVSIGCAFVACDGEDPHYHSYTTVKEATCTETGLKRCNCGDEVTIDALGHNYNDLDVCTRCGAKKPSPIEGNK